MESGLNIKYFSNFYTQEKADSIFKELMAYKFHPLSFKIRGRTYTPKRQVCAFGTKGLSYAFSGTQVNPEEWTPLMLEIKATVEEVTGETYNYALLNKYPDGRSKISPHKDNESSLDPDSSIPTLSFGAPRQMEFTRNNFQSQKKKLAHGSLLIMCPPTNVNWFHGIPAEPKVKEARISITFRKLKDLSSENVSQPPAKRQCLDSAFNDSALDVFFAQYSSDLQPQDTPKVSTKHCSQDKLTFSPTTSDLQFLDSLTSFPTTGDLQIVDNLTSNLSATKSEQLSNTCVFKKCLGEYLFLSCELYNGQLKVHLRYFFMNNQGELLPTKMGIVMDLNTWYDFYSKIFNFNLIYSTSSFVANNVILVLNTNNEITIYNLEKSFFLKLNEEQWSSLKEFAYDLNEVVIPYMYENFLIDLIKREREVIDLSSDEEDSLMVSLIRCVENDLLSVFKAVFECMGCKINHPSQDEHQCMTKTNLQKLNELGDNVFMLVNIENVVRQFISENNHVSQNFLSAISVKLIIDVCFKSPQ